MAVSRGLGLRAGPGIVLRTPLLPMSALAAWGALDEGGARAYLAALLDEPAVREALYVASPGLSAAIAAWREAPSAPAGVRVEHAVVKYVARMMFRATPFGLFSGVSTGKLGRETAVALAPRAEYRRRTRLDNDYLFALIDELVKQPAIRARLHFRRNTSAYEIADRLRYACAKLAGTERSYHLVSAELSDYLRATLARAAAGATPDALAAPLAGGDITADEAVAYIDELIDAQVLVPELGVHVTGPEPIDGVIAQLDRAALAGPRDALATARGRLAALDAHGVGNAPDAYGAIAASLGALPAPIDPARLIQVDLVKPAAVTLATRVAADVARVIERLAAITPAHDDLADFKRAFRTRWEDREIPLALALDEESGIGFETSRHPSAAGAPLLAELPFPRGVEEPRAPWAASERHLLRLLATALARGDRAIALTDADLTAMAAATPTVLPDALAAMIRIAAAPEQPAPTLLFEGATGPSGARLLGRFCHADPEIDAIVRAHLAAEEALHPDAIFAEIVHLNEGRIGNILCRPVLRAHEVVYLGVSGAPRDAQIEIADLLVSIQQDRVVLTSRRLGREVRPRLSTAHNYRLRSLGVYRFLCALANQDCGGVHWSWGALGSAPFLPRVTLDGVVLARAIWNLDAAELAPLTAAVRAANHRAELRPDVARAVAALRRTRALPRMFAVSSGDNELPIDLDNPLLAAAFAHEVSGETGARLIELFPAADELVVRGPEGAYTNEIVLTFTRMPPQPPAPPRRAESRRDHAAARREFPPGSEWLYAKIYCGESTADRVLCEAIAPVVRDALAAGDADRWFFIRYHDPDSHLRVRLHGDPARLRERVWPALERALAPLCEAGAVRALALDTYVRELERYGHRAIDLVEQLFWRDSEAVLGIVELLDGDAGAHARWKLAVRGIDAMLDAIGLSAADRERVAVQGKTALGQEMRADTALWAKIGERFTRERADLELIFARDPARDADHDLAPGFELLARRDAALADVGAELQRLDTAGELAPRLRDIAWSLAHMHANRLLHAAQRAQELVLYDFIRRLHAARRARSRP